MSADSGVYILELQNNGMPEYRVQKMHAGENVFSNISYVYNAFVHAAPFFCYKKALEHAQLIDDTEHGINKIIKFRSSEWEAIRDTYERSLYIGV